MQAVILAVGEGTRMRPLTYTRPKVMLPVANKPILQHIIENLAKVGVEEVVLVVGYRDDKKVFRRRNEWNKDKIRPANETARPMLCLGKKLPL